MIKNCGTIGPRPAGQGGGVDGGRPLHCWPCKAKKDLSDISESRSLQWCWILHARLVIEGDIGVLSKCAEDCSGLVLFEGRPLEIVYTRLRIWLWKGWRFSTWVCCGRNQDIRYDLFVEGIKILVTTLWWKDSDIWHNFVVEGIKIFGTTC